MLPPPTTTATCTPRSTTSRICVAIAAMRSGSEPYSSWPIRASPESFSRTRRKAGSPPGAPSPSGPPALVTRRLLLPHREPREAAHHHVLANLGGDLLADLLDG